MERPIRIWPSPVFLGAGLDGIANCKDDATVPPVYDNIFALTREQREAQGIPNLPENLKGRDQRDEGDPLILDVLGDHTFGKYVEAKEIEWDKFRTLVTPWELQQYLVK
jgi:glutamine synthetase